MNPKTTFKRATAQATLICLLFALMLYSNGQKHDLWIVGAAYLFVVALMAISTFFKSKNPYVGLGGYDPSTINHRKIDWGWLVIWVVTAAIFIVSIGNNIWMDLAFVGLCAMFYWSTAGTTGWLSSTQVKPNFRKDIPNYQEPPSDTQKKY